MSASYAAGTGGAAIGPYGLAAAPRAPVSLEVLLQELPDLTSGSLIPLAEVVDACINEIYNRLVELQDVLPSRHEKARAREVFQFALWARRECVRLLAVARWCREGPAVVKALNAVEFLQRQNGQLGAVVDELAGVCSGLSGTRLRNPDILTSLDVLTTGKYLRLPTRYQTDFEPVEPISDGDVSRALHQLDGVIRYRLRIVEVVPAEMGSFRIADGRVLFHCPGLFKAAFSLTGAQDDGPSPPPEETGENLARGGTWYLLDLEWDFGIGGREGVEDLRRDFPTTPPKPVFEEIAQHCKLQLTPPLPAPLPAGLPNADPSVDVPSSGPAQQATPASGSPYVRMHSPVSIDIKLETGSAGSSLWPVGKLKEEAVDEERVTDAPLVRAYNLLEALGLTFQLEILHAQAVRMQQLGWAQCFALELGRDRKAFKISYWPRQRTPRTVGAPNSPSMAGTITISLGSTSPSGLAGSAGGGILRRTLNEVETSIKASMLRAVDTDADGSGARSATRISDEVLATSLRADWEIERRWSGGLEVAAGLTQQQQLRVDPLNLDLERLLLDALRSHANALVKAIYRRALDHGPMAAVYDIDGGDVQLVEEEPDLWVMQVRLHGAQHVSVLVDPRSGRIVLRDKNEVVSASGESRLAMSMRMANDNPAVINDVLVRLKLSSTADAVDQRLVLTAPKLTTPASRQRKTAIALHAPLLARYDRLRLATPTTPGLRTLVWTQSIGSYCFVYQLGKQRHGISFQMLPATSTRRYLITDAAVMTVGQAFALTSKPAFAPAGLLAPAPTGLDPLSSPNQACRPRFCPIPNLQATFQRVLDTIAIRPANALTPIEQRKRDERAAPVVVLDGQRAVSELTHGPELLEALELAIIDALLAHSVVDLARSSPRALSMLPMLASELVDG